MPFPRIGAHLRNILLLGGGTVLGQALAVGAMPVVTRMYRPDQLGQLGLFLSFLGFAGIAVTLRLEMAIASETSQRSADYLLAISFAMALPVSVLAGLVQLLMIKCDILSYGSLPAWTAAAMAATLAATGVFVSLRYWFVRQQRFAEISRAMVAQGAARAVVPIALGAAGCGWIGLLAGEIAGRAMGLYRMLVLAWPRLADVVRGWDRTEAAAVLGRNVKLPLIGLPSSLLDALAAALPLPLIASLHGMEAAGQFLLVHRLAALPAGLVIASVSDVYHPVLAQTHRDQPALLRPTVLRIAGRMLLVASAIYLPLCAAAPAMFAPLFGSQWARAGVIMAIVAPVHLAALTVSPLSRVLYIVDRIEYKLVFDVFSLLVPVVSLYGFHLMGWGLYRCLAVYSVLHLCSSCIYFGLIWKASGSACPGGAPRC